MQGASWTQGYGYINVFLIRNVRKKAKNVAKTSFTLHLRQQLSSARPPHAQLLFVLRKRQISKLSNNNNNNKNKNKDSDYLFHITVHCNQSFSELANPSLTTLSTRSEKRKSSHTSRERAQDKP